MGLMNLFSRCLCQCQTKKKGGHHQNNNKKESQACSRYIDSKIFMPDYNNFSRNFVMSPTTFDLPHEIICLKTKDDVLLFAYLVLQDYPTYTVLPTVIMFHGNGGNVGDCLQLIDRFYQGVSVNVLAVEYRGFGLSQGVASEDGVYLDGQAAFDYINQRLDLDSSKIVVYGISLGGAVAIDLAIQPDYKDNIACLIIENTFACLNELVESKMPKCCLPAIKLFPLSKKFSNISKIGGIKCPTLFISGLKDELIPSSHMNNLYTNCGAKSKKIIRFQEGTHLSTWSLHNYAQEVATFIVNSITKHPVHNNRVNNNNNNDDEDSEAQDENINSVT